MLTILVFVSAVVIIDCVHPVEAVGTIYIRADGSIDPPTAPISQNDNVYVLTGNITSNAGGVVIERNNCVFDGSGYTIHGMEDESGIALLNRSKVTIKSVKISNFASGIVLTNSSCNGLFGNTVSDNVRGIDLWNSSGNTLSGNTVRSNDEGICISWYSSDNTLVDNTVTDGEKGVTLDFDSDYATLSGNIISDTHQGITLFHSLHCVMSRNTLVNNQHGMVLTDPAYEMIFHNNFLNNTVPAEVNLWCSPHITWHNGFPSGGNYWSDYRTRYPSASEIDASGIWDTPYSIEGAKQSDPYPLVHPVVEDRIVVPDDYSTIQEAINHADEGDTVLVRAGTYSELVSVNRTVSLIGESKDSTILNGTGTNPVLIAEANNVRISGFSFEGWSFRSVVINSTTGVLIVGNRITFNALGIDVENSVNVTIENNIIEGNGLDNIGIMLSHSTDCRIANNTIANAVYDGVRLWFSNNNLLNRNLIKDNDHGVFLHGSNENTISENTISKSGGAGIYFEYGNLDNKILHNNFRDNWTPVGFWDSSANVWDNGCEGNYWSDYSSNDSDHDGVGDLPYAIDSNNIDHYPLMSPYWIPADVNHDLEINIFDVVRITGAYSTTPASPNWNPHADVAEPYGKVDTSDVVLCTRHYGKRWP